MNMSFYRRLSAFSDAGFRPSSPIRGNLCSSVAKNLRASLRHLCNPCNPPNNRRASLWMALFLLFSAPALAQTPRQFGSLSYPAPGNLEWDEGTVELWFVSDFDADARKAGATLFDIQSPAAEQWHYILSFIPWGQALAMVGYIQPQQSYVWSAKLHWKPGERHYVAWTWQGRLRSLYVDGQVGHSPPGHGPVQGEGRIDSTQDVPVEGPLHGSLSGAKLTVGMGNSNLTIDEIRISSVARSAAEIARLQAAGAAPTRDEHTLLLDHCDGGPAEVISGVSGEKGGTLSGATRIVDGRFGKAIQLWSE